MTLRTFANLIAVGVLLGMLGWATISAPRAEAAGLVSNDCYGWAVALGKEGKVSDSLHMHLLGCDDGPWRTMHYRAVAGECQAEARALIRTNPEYFMRRPWTVARIVKENNEGCIVYEDGSYEAI